MKTSVFLHNFNDRQKFVERRHKKDWVVQSVSIIALVGWLCAFTALTFISEAKPETVNFFSRLFNYRVKGYWDDTLLRIGVGALLVSFITCITGFFVNMSRHHRKTDRYNKSIIILGVTTFVMLLIYIQILI